MDHIIWPRLTRFGAKYPYLYNAKYNIVDSIYLIFHCSLIIFPSTSHRCRLDSSINPIHYIPMMLLLFYPQLNSQ